MSQERKIKHGIEDQVQTIKHVAGLRKITGVQIVGTPRLERLSGGTGGVVNVTNRFMWGVAGHGWGAGQWNS